MGGSNSKSIVAGVRRKIKKPLQYYRPLERAHKVLEKQDKIPRRAPMNIKKVEIPHNIRKEKLKEIEEMQKHDPNYLQHFTKVKVSSIDPDSFKPIPENMHSHARSQSLIDSLPKSTGTNKEPHNMEPLKGTAIIEDIIDAISNHKEDPETWTPATIAEHLHLRPLDVKNLLKCYDLLDKSAVQTLDNPDKKDVRFSSFI